MAELRDLLASLVLLKNEWFPLVVTRGDKGSYLSAIRQADQGDLKPLTTLMGDLQRLAVRQALSLSEEVERETHAIESIFASVAGRIQRRRQEQRAAYQRAVTTASALNEMTAQRMKDLAKEASRVIKVEDRDYHAVVRSAMHDQKEACFNRWQIVKAAKEVGYFANLQTYPSWVELQI